ncbi:MAG TPA: ABC transporter ATP-binding protein [Mycobacteriales bacterium]|nr:ABC transporter ATP-binding protein [Mycobacteriales bacterium]
MVLAVIASVGSIACGLAIPQVVRTFVNQVLVDGHHSRLWPLALVVLALSAIRSFTNYFRRNASGIVSVRVETELRDRIFAHLQGLPVSFHDSWQTGQLLARATSDLNAIRELIAYGVLFLCVLSVLGIGVIVALAVIDPLLGLVVAAIVPVIVLSARHFDRVVEHDVQESRELVGDLVSTVEEAASGVRVIKAFGREEQEIQRLRAQADRLRTVNLRVVRTRSRWVPLLALLPNLMTAAVLGIGGYRVLHGALDLGGLVAAYQYLGLLALPLRNVGWILTMGQQADAASRRVFEVLDTEPEIADAPDAHVLDTVEGSIDLADVVVRYSPEGPAVLDGVSLSVAPGECVAVVGPSGCGKSTLVALLSRFHDPSSGDVRLDGHALRDVSLHSLRSQVGVVFDEAVLFSGSVRSNIAFGIPDASDEEIEEAARLAGAHEFILGLPDGYETRVGESGYGLSGGQRQRIALARALLSQPRVLVLDDPLSAVDPRTEALIEANLRTVIRGRTTLLVAHRASTISMADRVVLLDGGRIVAEGPHAKLLRSNARYRSLLAAAEDDHELALRAGFVLDEVAP